MAASIIQNMDDFYYHRTENKTCSNSTQHFHSGFEVYYMKEGKCHYFINDSAFDIVSGDIILIPEGTLHGTSYGSKPCTRLLINLQSDFIAPEILEGIKKIGYLYRNPDSIPAINSIFTRIEYEYNHGDSISRAALKAHVEALFMVIIRNQGTKIVQDRNTIVEAAIRYIQHLSLIHI